MGYTSYDVGAAIAEDRQITREKYSELKLQANFLQASPEYLISQPSEGTFGLYTNTSALATTLLSGSEQNGSFYIVRHADWTSNATVTYQLHVVANRQNITLPQLGGALSLVGRDSKVHVTDYNIGSMRLHYSTAEVFTWKRSMSKTVLILYDGAGETHEFAVAEALGLPSSIEGNGITSTAIARSVVVQWDVQPARRAVHFGSTLEVHLLWRNEAYQYWTTDFTSAEPIGNFYSASRINSTDSAVIVKAGYLVRNASFSNNALHLWGDINQTTTIEVISSPPLAKGAELYFNEQLVADAVFVEGRLTGTVRFIPPNITLPDLNTANWSYLDSLPETRPGYDDTMWTIANLTSTNNTRHLTTPTSLYAGDYGYHTGSLIYRGHFTATGSETSIILSLSGGNAFSHSVWLNSTHLGSWVGDPNQLLYNQTLAISTTLSSGAEYTITILIDHMGLTEDSYIGAEAIKEPRGILDYSIVGHAQTGIL